jgi:hypothetical protein
MGIDDWRITRIAKLTIQDRHALLNRCVGILILENHDPRIATGKCPQEGDFALLCHLFDG